MSTKLIFALVLCDVVAHGLKAGQLLEASPELVKALAADGSVDPHKSAVAHARDTGAPTVRSSVELAAEASRAQREALLAEIAKAEAALASATDDAVRTALQRDIEQSRAALSELDG